MKIAVTGGKGGTGKSTVAASLAVELAKTKGVLLVDADVECPNDHLILSAGRKKDRDIFQMIPKWDFRKCTKCGECGRVCKQNAIVSVRGMRPAFVPEMCIGCQACMVACPVNAIGRGRKRIGTIYRGRNYKTELVSGELKLGELSSGEIVAELRKRADQIAGELKPEVMLIDSAAGVGCPVIASINGTDFVVAVTEPTPSALHDLRRVLYIAGHFNIPRGIVINKSDLERGFCKRIEAFAKRSSIPILGRLPYSQDFVDSMIRMKPIVAYKREYQDLFAGILASVERITG